MVRFIARPLISAYSDLVTIFTVNLFFLGELNFSRSVGTREMVMFVATLGASTR